MRTVLLLLLSLPASSALPYTTWDEPWHEEVVRAADSFVELEVVDVAENRTKVSCRLVEQIAGAPVPATFAIDHYSMLSTPTRSSPDDELGMRLRKGNTYFAFLDDPRHGDTFALATPSAGWAFLTEGNVIATYRHSYHLALVPRDLYVPSQKAIFTHLHGGKADAKFVRKLFDDWLRRPPQGPSDDGDDNRVFACQHVALECFYYFGTDVDAGLLTPFLASDSGHVQISAVRALSAIDTAASRARLFDCLRGDHEPFAKVMAVWGLRRLDAREYSARLEEFAKTEAAAAEAGFGGSIMDPRVGTRFPRSVRAAVQEVLREWAAPKPAKGTGQASGGGRERD